MIFLNAMTPSYNKSLDYNTLTNIVQNITLDILDDNTSINISIIAHQPDTEGILSHQDSILEILNIDREHSHMQFDYHEQKITIDFMLEQFKSFEQQIEQFFNTSQKDDKITTIILPVLKLQIQQNEKNDIYIYKHKIVELTQKHLVFSGELEYYQKNIDKYITYQPCFKCHELIKEDGSICNQLVTKHKTNSSKCNAWITEDDINRNIRNDNTKKQCTCDKLTEKCNELNNDMQILLQNYHKLTHAYRILPTYFCISYTCNNHIEVKEKSLPIYKKIPHFISIKRI